MPKKRGQENKEKQATSKLTKKLSEGAIKDQLMQYAIQAGLQSLVSQPNLKHYAVLMSNNLDMDKIYSARDKIEEELGKVEMSEEDSHNLFYKNLASYVASGNALKDKAKKIILKEGYEGRSNQSLIERILDFFKPDKFEGAKYFRNATEAYGMMSDILSQNEVAQKEIPALTKAAKSLKMYGFLKDALVNFKEGGLRDDQWYKKFSYELDKGTAMKAEKGIKGLEDYILTLSEKEESSKEKSPEKNTAYKVTAGLALILGLALIVLARVNLTGNVVGNISYKTSGIIGIVLTIIAIILFFLIHRYSK